NTSRYRARHIQESVRRSGGRGNKLIVRAVYRIPDVVVISVDVDATRRLRDVLPEIRFDVSAVEQRQVELPIENPDRIVVEVFGSRRRNTIGQRAVRRNG